MRFRSCLRHDFDAPKDVVVRVHAANINPIDVKKADRALNLAVKDSFPYKIGYDCAGTVTQVGLDVNWFKVGDAVYNTLPEVFRGSCSEIVKCAEEYVSLKPSTSSFEEAASIPIAAMTALQALRKYRGNFAEKTVVVPAGLSGTGLFACQLAENVFHAGKVITTVSTAKIPNFRELFGDNTADQLPIQMAPVDHESMDFLFDTVGIAMQYLCLMRPGSSRIVSIATLPSGLELQNSSLLDLPRRPTIPIPFRLGLDLLDQVRRLRARRCEVEYSYTFLNSSGKDLDELRQYVKKGWLKTVVGTIVDIRNVKFVRSACEVVHNGKGGLGKSVIRVSTADNHS